MIAPGLKGRLASMFSTEPPPEFEPSPLLVLSFKRARTLNRNIRRASSFNPRAHRRAAAAAEGVRALARHEHNAFKEAHAT